MEDSLSASDVYYLVIATLTLIFTIRIAIRIWRLQEHRTSRAKTVDRSLAQANILTGLLQYYKGNHEKEEKLLVEIKKHLKDAGYGSERYEKELFTEVIN